MQSCTGNLAEHIAMAYPSSGEKAGPVKGQGSREKPDSSNGEKTADSETSTAPSTGKKGLCSQAKASQMKGRMTGSGTAQSSEKKASQRRGGKFPAGEKPVGRTNQQVEIPPCLL